ncbi:MAG: hypothetical protein CL447_00770 [Acidimicrobiaceae bacterium]|nr:hypothetical protein [Acidimicrobiaceae bacterium]HBU75265.1 hypothetical protein [Acidimicrobiaceae bacterium]
MRIPVAVVVLSAITASLLSGCGGSITVVDDSEPKVLQEVCRPPEMGSRPIKGILYDDGSITWVQPMEFCD